MNSLAVLRFVQIVFCFPMIIIFATSHMDKPEQIIFIILFSLYTMAYEIIFLALKNKHKKRRHEDDYY